MSYKSHFDYLIKGLLPDMKYHLGNITPEYRVKVFEELFKDFCEFCGKKIIDEDGCGCI